MEEGGEFLKEGLMAVGHPDVGHIGARHVVTGHALLRVVRPQPELLDLGVRIVVIVVVGWSGWWWFGVVSGWSGWW